MQDMQETDLTWPDLTKFKKIKNFLFKVFVVLVTLMSVIENECLTQTIDKPPPAVICEGTTKTLDCLGKIMSFYCLQIIIFCLQLYWKIETRLLFFGLHIPFPKKITLLNFLYFFILFRKEDFCSVCILWKEICQWVQSWSRPCQLHHSTYSF